MLLATTSCSSTALSWPEPIGRPTTVRQGAIFGHTVNIVQPSCGAANSADTQPGARHCDDSRNFVSFHDLRYASSKAPLATRAHCAPLIDAFPSGRESSYERNTNSDDGSMLRGYFDDSVSAEFFVVAGYIATAEAWVAFSEEWRAALDAEPRIQYFSMTDALFRRGQFNGFTERERDAKLHVLHSIITKHITRGVAYVLSVPMFREVFRAGQITKTLDNPKFQTHAQAMTCGLVSEAARQHRLKMTGTIEFIFDEMDPTTLRELVAYWRLMKRDLRFSAHMGGADPVTADDKFILPLQAADFLAGASRRTRDEKLAGIHAQDSTMAKMGLGDFLPADGRRLYVEPTRESLERIRYASGLFMTEYENGKIRSARLEQNRRFFAGEKQ
jgi:hypothetical protein